MPHSRGFFKIQNVTSLLTPQFPLHIVDISYCGMPGIFPNALASSLITASPALFQLNLLTHVLPCPDALLCSSIPFPKSYLSFT